MVYYSEDNPNVASSILMSSLLNVFYLGANTNMASLLETGNNFAIYLDVVPDNDDLVKLRDDYMDIVSTRRVLEKNVNIYIFLIPCIEYCIIVALVKLGVSFMFKYPWVEIVLEHVLRKQTICKRYPPRTIGYAGSFRSFEKQCKLVLENSSDIYLNYNTVEYKYKDILNSISWYLTDMYGLTMQEKAVAIAHELPAVSFIGDVPEGFSLVTSMKRKEYETEEAYLAWKGSFQKVILPKDWWLDENADELLQEMRRN